jgi:hypothetical protein
MRPEPAVAEIGKIIFLRLTGTSFKMVRETGDSKCPKIVSKGFTFKGSKTSTSKRSI